MKIKCFALWQPWATLVIEGYKEIETRPSYNSHRGLTGIHATKSQPAYCEQLFYSDEFYHFLQARGYNSFKDLPQSGVLGTVQVMDWKKIITGREPDPRYEMIKPKNHEQYLGDYNPGRYGIRMADVRKFEHKFPALGQQNMLFDIDIPENILKQYKSI